MQRPPGVEFHTCTVIGHCGRTGRLGIATATRSLAVDARVPPLHDWLQQHVPQP